MFQSVLKACFHKQIGIFGFITCLHVSEKALLLSCTVQDVPDCFISHQKSQWA